MDVARALTSLDVLGQREAVVSVYSECGVDSLGRNVSLMRGQTARVDTSTGNVLTTPRQLNPAPPSVTLAPVAVLPPLADSHRDDSLSIRGLLGGERVHVFGQKMKPMSFITPQNAKNISINLPSVGVSEDDDTVVPGFLYAQVLAPGMSAGATELYRVLVLDSLEMKRELDALQRGKGGGRRGGGGWMDGGGGGGFGVN